MDKTYLLFSCAHQESRLWPRARCTHKMTRYFAGTTLLDLFAEKFALLAKSPMFRDAWIEVPARSSEDVVASALVDRGVAVARAADGHYSTLRKSDASHVVWVNPCLPLLDPGTILKAVAAFHGSDAGGLTTVVRDQNWFWDIDSRKSLTIMDPSHVRLQEARSMYRSTHACHIYERQRKLDTGGYWDLAEKPPMLFEVAPNEECMDIDSELDFEKADALLTMRRKT